MRKFLRWWFGFQNKERLLFLVALLAINVYAAKVAYQSEIQAFPELTNVQVQVITQYPGKAAEEVERQVTVPLEVAMTGLNGLITHRSISLFGLSVITLTFEDDAVLRQARIDVAQRLSDADLPEGLKPNLSPESTPVGEVFRYVLDSDLPVDELRFLQDWTLVRELKSVSGVADVVSFGGPTRTIEVQLNLPQLNSLGLTPSQVAQALSQNHANAGGSIITHGAENYIVRSLGLFEKAEDLENAVIGTQHGTPIRVRDIGNVRLAHRVRLGQVGVNGRDDVVEGIVLLRQGSDTLKTCADIREKIRTLNDGGLPTGVKIKTYYDRTDLISKSSKTVFHNILFGIILVGAVLILGLGLEAWPLILSVSTIIPFALLMAFMGIKASGYAPNLISLGAVDFGIIIETAIFAAEAIISAICLTGRRDDETFAEAIGSVLAPAFVCALLLIIAFVPILSLQRVEGRIFKPLGITLVFALVGGQLGAVIFIPLLSKHLRLGKVHRTFLDPFFVRLNTFCQRAVLRLAELKYPKATVGVFFFASILFLFLVTGREFLPSLNEGALWIRATAPPTISREESVELASQIRSSLKTIPEVKHVISQVGRPDDGTDVNGFDNIEMLVVLDDPSRWKSAHDIDGFIDLAQAALKDFKGVTFNFSQPIKDNVDEAISGVKGELVVKIFGSKLTELQARANELVTILKDVRGADDVASEQLLGQPELRFTMNHDLLARYGLRVTDAEDVLETGLMGKAATRMFDEQGRFIDVLVKPMFLENLSQRVLASLPILTPEGAKIPLGDISDPQLTEGVGRIYRENGLRRIAVKCSVRGRAVVAFVREASQQIGRKLHLPSDYKLRWSGSFENAERAGRRLIVIVPLCILAIITLLHVWFKNWVNVGLILWEIPFSILGALFALKIAGQNLSISAVCGGIVLVGVSLLSGMMLIDDWKESNDWASSLQRKLRGIVISNCVAIVGLIPAAFSHGIGSETAKPFAIAIFGGLASSLIFTLLVLPAFLALKEKSRVTAQVLAPG